MRNGKNQLFSNHNYASIKKKPVAKKLPVFLPVFFTYNKLLTVVKKNSNIRQI